MPPQAKATLARSWLGTLLATAQTAFRGNSHAVAQALAKQLRFQMVAIAAVDVRQCATVLVFTFNTRHQPDAIIIGLDQGLQSPPGSFGIGLTGTSLATHFRGIDTDQPHTAAIDQTQGVAINHLSYRYPLGLIRQWAERQDREMPDCAHKKGAHKGRLLQQQCETRRIRHAHDYFLAPNMPKRSANFCTRPPVSRTFCLPV